MSALKPIVVYHANGGPNPYKVLIALAELNLPYTKTAVSDVKGGEFCKINPNGRVPAIMDPNNDDLILWESGAIVEYLVETYDKEGKLSLPGNREKWMLKQYLHFQMSGQGPYFGQAVWFYRQSEPNVQAKERYIDQVVRVLGVLDGILKDREYLHVRGLSFIPWNRVALGAPFFKEELWDKYDIATRFPNFVAWHERLNSRASVKTAYEL
ncbi:glutathione s-transferase ii [Colletotrichum plurivorum]|uniref:Glutathione s-transferase ii n=1 Tax=Colletotrichum plurivorum TaxID=2175906 RepID=A0A8H6K5H8_9PEZI|nr:glutathione s-transferase ii [Colletotrichum plurivorum]